MVKYYFIFLLKESLAEIEAFWLLSKIQIFDHHAHTIYRMATLWNDISAKGSKAKFY